MTAPCGKMLSATNSPISGYGSAIAAIVGFNNRSGKVAIECQAAFTQITLQKRLKTRLVNGQFTARQAGNEFQVFIHARNVKAKLGETNA